MYTIHHVFPHDVSDCLEAKGALGILLFQEQRVLHDRTYTINAAIQDFLIFFGLKKVRLPIPAATLQALRGIAKNLRYDMFDVSTLILSFYVRRRRRRLLSEFFPVAKMLPRSRTRSLAPVALLESGSSKTAKSNALATPFSDFLSLLDDPFCFLLSSPFDF